MALNPLDLFSRPSPLDLQPPSAAARDSLPAPHFEMLLQCAPSTQPTSVPPPRPAQVNETKPSQNAQAESAPGDDMTARQADGPLDRADDPSSAGPDDASAAAEGEEAQTARHEDPSNESTEDDQDKKKIKEDSAGLEAILCVAMPHSTPVNAEHVASTADVAGEEAAVEAPLPCGDVPSSQYFCVEIPQSEEPGVVGKPDSVAVDALSQIAVEADGNALEEVQVVTTGADAKAAPAGAETKVKATKLAVEKSAEVSAAPEGSVDETAIKSDAEGFDADQISQAAEHSLGEDSTDKPKEEPEQSPEHTEARDAANPASAANELNAAQEKTPEPVAAVEPKDNSLNSKSDANATAPISTGIVDAAPRGTSPLRFSAKALAQDGLGPSGPKANIEVDATRFLHRVTKAFEAAQERGGEIRLRLSPPELGSLRLDVRIQDGALIARLETETAAAKTVLIENLPALRDRLAEQGIRIERFDVDLMQHHAGGPPDQPQDRSQTDHNPFVRANRPVAAPTPSETSFFAPPSPLGITAEGLNVII